MKKPRSRRGWRHPADRAGPNAAIGPAGMAAAPARAQRASPAWSADAKNRPLSEPAA